MAAPKQPFDGAAAIFNEHATTLRGYVRYHVIEANLAPFLTKKSMKVLDVGGGSGIDAAWLAVKGHRVTLLEPSQVQCNAAEARFNYFLNESERKRITIVPGSFAELPKIPAGYDLVLMHGVAMYQSDPAGFIKRAATFLKKGGIFSVVEKGYYGAQARVIQRGEESQLESISGSHFFLNSLNMDVHIFKPEELKAHLKAAGVTVKEWSGVRVITDEMYQKVSEMEPDTLKNIVAAEYEQGRHPGIRAQGQMLHFIGRKN